MAAAAMRVRIRAGSVAVEAELDGGEISRRLWEALPIEAVCSVWGAEVYFPVPVEAGNDDGREVVDAGDVAYWPPGRALCVFFGPTPASRGDEIRAASAVTVMGRVVTDLAPLWGIRSGQRVVIEGIEAPFAG